MKKNIHPAYQKVLFVDSASGHRFVCGSTLQTDARETFEGVEYPVSYLSISSSSHPLFTGSNKLVDSEGRVEKFKKRFGGIGSRKVEVPQEETAAHAPEKQAAAHTSAKAPATHAPAKAPAAHAPAKAPAAKQPAAKDQKKAEKKPVKPAKGA